MTFSRWLQRNRWDESMVYHRTVSMGFHNYFAIKSEGQQADGTRGYIMRLIRALTLLVITATLAACPVTLPVRGQIQNSDETFTGTATGGMGGGGTLTIVSNKGVRCSGNFVYVTSRQGQGVFTCSDGRTGPFEFASTGMSGTGYGDLGGQRFTFTFGR